jgi:undecaprenyl-diphosphatase
VRPVAAATERPARFVWNRFTPGELGLEVTTLLAIVAVGSFTFVLLGDAPEAALQDRMDDFAFEIADRMYSERLKDVAVWVTALGDLKLVSLVVAATAIWALSRRRWLDAAALVVGLLLCWAAVDFFKAAYDRPRPPGAHVETDGMAYPSGHATYAVAWVACAVALVRGGAGLATRFAVVTIAIAIAVVVGITRVYLRAHYLSDVNGGFGLAATIFGLCGLVALVAGHVRQNGEPQR